MYYLKQFWKSELQQWQKRRKQTSQGFCECFGGLYSPFQATFKFSFPSHYYHHHLLSRACSARLTFLFQMSSATHLCFSSLPFQMYLRIPKFHDDLTSSYQYESQSSVAFVAQPLSKRLLRADTVLNSYIHNLT